MRLEGQVNFVKPDDDDDGFAALAQPESALANESWTQIILRLRDFLAHAKLRHRKK
jgi:hypothetical protein